MIKSTAQNLVRTFFIKTLLPKEFLSTECKQALKIDVGVQLAVTTYVNLVGTMLEKMSEHKDVLSSDVCFNIGKHWDALNETNLQTQHSHIAKLLSKAIIQHSDNLVAQQLLDYKVQLDKIFHDYICLISRNEKTQFLQQRCK